MSRTSRLTLSQSAQHLRPESAMPDARASTRSPSGVRGMRWVRREVVQLQAVLEQPQRAVVAGEGGGIGATDVALVHERVEGVEGAALADAGRR